MNEQNNFPWIDKPSNHNQWGSSQRQPQTERQIFKIMTDTGDTILVTKKILTSKPGSRLATLFSDEANLEFLDDGSVFLPRDTKAFKMMINYLRYGDSFLPTDPKTLEERLMMSEIDYWQIMNPPQPQSEAVNSLKPEEVFPPEVLEFSQKPLNKENFPYLDPES